MVTLLKEGITIHTAAEGNIIQSAEVENTKEKSTVLGMKGTPAKTQVVKVFDHTEINKFSVTGKGDLTMLTGVGVDPLLTLITGGIVIVESFKYTQKIGEPSDWGYSGEHYPYAA